MYLVGTMCGGYDFYGFLGGIKLWLGPNERSDIDVVLEQGEILPHGFERQVGEIGFFMAIKSPYRKRGLIVPEDKSYLSFALERRLLKNKKMELVFQSRNKEVFF